MRNVDTIRPSRQPIDDGDGEAGDGATQRRAPSPSTDCRRGSCRRARGTPCPARGARSPASTSIHTTICQTSSARAMAATFGHAADHMARRRERAAGLFGLQRVEAGDLAGQLVVCLGEDLVHGLNGHGGRTSWRSRSVISAASAADGRLLDPPRAGEADLELRGDPTGSAGQQHHPVAEAGRLAHVVGDEHDRRSRSAARSARARRAGCRGSSRRGRRTARPSAGRRPPGPAPGRGRRAGASRRTARAGGWSAKSPRCTSSSSSATSPLAIGPLTLPSLMASSMLPAHRQPGEQGGLLEHQPGAPDDLDGAGGRLVQPGEEVEQRALAAAGRADEAQELAASHREVDAVECLDPLAARAEVLGDVAHPHRVGHPGMAVHDSGRFTGEQRHHSPFTGASPLACSSSLSRSSE